MRSTQQLFPPIATTPLMLSTPLDSALPAPADHGLHKMRLLLVDDNPVNLELLEELLRDAGYEQLLSLDDPRHVEELSASWEPDLLLLDLHMPERSGYEVLEGMQGYTLGPDNLPVLVITADTSVQARHRALQAGARDFVTKPIDSIELELRVRAHLITRELQRQLRGRNQELEDAVAQRTQELERARLESLAVLASVAEYHDDETHQHTRRVGQLAAALAGRLGVEEPFVDMIRDAAPLHDIGKIGISKDILLKPGSLTAQERVIVQRHVNIGSEILSRTSSPTLRLAEEIARTHHERWDGRGYGVGLAGVSIPLSGRIAAVADVFDALTHARPYKEAWPLDQALSEIAAGAGTQFDPHVASALLEVDHCELAGLITVPLL